MKNFWLKIKKPIYVLAPMAGVADSAFRQIGKSFGADVVYSEMISATAIAYKSKKTLKLMKFAKIERPYVVQLFGSKPEHFAVAAKYITKKIKPDGIDINFGCPVKKVLKQGAGAALMGNLKRVREIVGSVIDNTDLPVSVKCRAQVKEVTAVDFLKSLSGLNIKAVMIHGRTLVQGNNGEVNRKMIKQARPFVKGVLLANGGVKDKKTAEKLLAKTGADGLAVGQAALGRPWIFQELKSGKPEAKSRSEIFKIILKHARLAGKLKGEQGIIEMRKHLCWYVNGLPKASSLRLKLVKAASLKDIKRILK
jgi:tRNA-dihydrouridine synthase B